MMTTPNTMGLEIINDAKSFPCEAGRYEVFFGCDSDPSADRMGTVADFEVACRDAATLLAERADWVRIVDHVRGYCIARGRA